MAIGGVLFDIDGVLVTSWNPIPGAAETLQVLARNQIVANDLRIQQADLDDAFVALTGRKLDN